MTNTPLLYNIKRPPAALVLAAAVAPTLRPPAVDVSIHPDPARVSFVAPGYLASVNAWMYPDAAPLRSVARGPFYRGRGTRGPWPPGPSCYSGGIYNPARLASTAAAPNSPARLDDQSQPNGLNGSKAVERPERPERLKVTRTNDLNDLNDSNDLKQAHRYPGGVFKAERVERLK